ncbi:MAG TPA: HlyD family efflux transporter periplasmic adaptor subunit [Kofleriaceae bacterium]|nr:HlyD family efflux transporter periplasmic adaptor subunit [Kofleriaceae bacterium]
MSRGARLILLAGAGLVIAAAVAFFSWMRAGDERRAVPTYRVESGTFRREVPSDGNLKAVETTPILSPQDARMPLKVAWIVEDGTRVTAGQVVARMDPSEMEDRLRDGRDTALQVRKRLAMESTTSASSFRKRDREASMAESEMRASSSVKYENDEIFSRNEIIESQIDQDLASAKMSHARAAKGIERSVSAGKLDVLKVQERQAEMAIERAEKGLSKLEVVTPDAGVMMLHRDWRGRILSVGDTVWPGQKIGEVPRDQALEAEVFVLEADGGSLEVGMKAQVVLESRPGKTYSATIKRVDTLAKPRIPEVPVQYFAVVLTLEGIDDSAMKIGQRVRATILVAESEAITVPREAVFTRAGKNYVYRKAGNDFDEVVVELGGGSAGRVSVTGGLSEGDEIALRKPAAASSPDSDNLGAEPHAPE